MSPEITEVRPLVLHLGAGLIYGGVESFLGSLARLSRETRPGFALCANGRLQQEVSEAGCPVEILPPVRLSRPLQILKARWALGRALDAKAPQFAVFHSGWMQILFVPVLRRRRIPYGVWIHGFSNDHDLLERLARRHRPDRVFTASRYMAEATAEWYPGVPRSCIHLPVAPPAVIQHPERARIRTELGASTDDVVIVISCRFEPWKGHEVLFRALGRLVSLPGWRLWVAGGAQERHEVARMSFLASLADRLGIGDRIRFLGQRTDVPSLLQSADLHCQPNSGPEPFGIAFIEALQAGVPVVSTAIGGALEIVSPECGVLVAPGDDAGLSEALSALLRDRDRRTRLAERTRHRADLLCNPTRQVARLESVLKETLRTVSRKSGKPPHR